MAQQEMMFSDYLRVISKRKWTVLALTVLVLGATYLWASRKDQIYTSTARIKIQKMQTMGDMFDQMFVSRGDPIENYIHEIKGDAVMKVAADVMVGMGRPVDPATLAGATSVKRVEGTDLIDIVANGPSADAARRRCDAVVKAFTDIHDKMITANVREESEYIQKSLSDATNSFSSLDGEMRIRLGELNLPELTDQIRVMKPRLVDSLIKLQVFRDQGNFTEDYPEIVTLKSTITTLESQLKDLTGKEATARTVIGEYEQKRKVLEEMVVFLTKRQEESRIAQMKKTERIEEIGRPSPGRPVTSGTTYLTGIGLMLGLMLGIIFAFVAENLDTSIRTLVEIEETFHLPILGVIPHFSPHDPDVPIGPDRFRDRVRYFMTMNSVAIVWRATRAAFSRRSRRTSLMPSKSTVLIVPFSPRAPATEGYRAIRTNLQMKAGEDRIGAVLVTSSGPAEGKSTTISNLAFSFAQAGKKTLLVCANMRRPSLHKTFGVTREHGLSDILVGEATWREVLKDHRDFALGDRAAEGLATTVGASNIFFISCGGKTIQPAEWLSLPVFQATVKEWESEFDVVLIDGPPILPVPDSVIISSSVRQVVLVYQSGATHRDSMLRAISLIEKVGVKITGLVLNDLKVSWTGSPDYFHYRGYYGRPEKT